MPSNFALGRTPVHVVFKRARTIYATRIRYGWDSMAAYRAAADYVNKQNLTPGTRGQVLAAVMVCPKPSAGA